MKSVRIHHHCRLPIFFPILICSLQNQERDLTLSKIATLQEKYKAKKKETRAVSLCHICRRKYRLECSPLVEDHLSGSNRFRGFKKDGDKEYSGTACEITVSSNPVQYRDDCWQPQAALARIHAHLQFLPRVSPGLRYLVEGPKRSLGLDILAYLKLAVSCL